MATLRHAILMFLTPFSPVSQLPLLWVGIVGPLNLAAQIPTNACWVSFQQTILVIR
jgi:hypothetical protein